MSIPRNDRMNRARITKLFTAVGVIGALSMSTAAPASAFGSMTYTAPWGCRAHFQSFQASNNNSQTIRQSSSGCSPMEARLVTSSGGGTTWAMDTWLAHKQSALTTPHSGGQHRICGGCTVWST